MASLAIGCGVAHLTALDLQLGSTHPKAFPVVAFDAANPDRYSMPSGAYLAPADSRYGTLVITDLEFPSLSAASQYVFGTASGGHTLRLTINTAGLLALLIRDDAAGISLVNIATLSPNTKYDIYVAIDIVQTTLGAGVTAYVNGSPVTPSGTWVGGAGKTVAYTNTTGVTNPIGGNIATPSDAASFTGYLGLLAIDCTQRLDLSDSGVRNGLAPQVIGPNGEGGFGRIPEVFVVGNAAQWNDAGGINWGTRPNFVKNGAAAVTDVSGSAWPGE